MCLGTGCVCVCGGEGGGNKQTCNAGLALHVRYFCIGLDPTMNVIYM